MVTLIIIIIVGGIAAIFLGAVIGLVVGVAGTLFRAARGVWRMVQRHA